jgi:hypothetical protein
MKAKEMGATVAVSWFSVGLFQKLYSGADYNKQFGSLSICGCKGLAIRLLLARPQESQVSLQAFVISDHLC